MTPSSPLPEIGPILSLTIAADVDASGSAIEPGATFGRTSPQVTAIAEIGSLDGPPGELVMSWTALGPGGDSALFEHRIPVKTAEIAFSTGLSPGRLAVGVYRVRATLNGSNVSADWIVADVAPQTAGRGPTDRIALAMAVNGGVAPEPAPEATDPAPEPTDPAPGPPVAGDSGTTTGAPSPQPSGSAAAGCSLAITPLGAGTTVSVDATGCADSTTIVAAGPPGGALTVIGQLKGDALLPFAVDPCNVGGSDLPEAKLGYAARIVKGRSAGTSASATVTIAPDADPPSVFVEPQPAADTFRFRGDPITLTIRAQDGSMIGTGQSGIAEVRVTDSSARTLSHQRYSEPAACDKSRLEKKLSVETTIPDDAGDVYTVFVRAIDFAGNAQEIALGWRTKAVWGGTLVATATAEVSGNSCRAKWLVIVELDPVTGRGPVTGAALADPQARPTCTYGTGTPGLIADSYHLRVEGTFDGKQFSLRLVPVDWSGYDVALHVLHYPNLRTLDLPVSASGRSASLVFKITQSGVAEIAGGGATATLDGDIFLSCDCDSQPSAWP